MLLLLLYYFVGDRTKSQSIFAKEVQCHPSSIGVGLTNNCCCCCYGWELNPCRWYAKKKSEPRYHVAAPFLRFMSTFTLKLSSLKVLIQYDTAFYSKLIYIFQQGYHVFVYFQRASKGTRAWTRSKFLCSIPGRTSRTKG